MPVLGTKKFWKPAPGASTTQKENQILKNAGYINIQLHSVSYMSVGNFWQRTFGGKDNIVLSTNLKYQSGVEAIDAVSVQDIRQVKANRNYNLGLQRPIAVKIPANGNSLGLEVKMTAVKTDSLQAKFDLLNSSDFQKPLELAPKIVGQVLTVTTLVKKLFTDSDPGAQLEASYAGIISLQPEDNPVNNGKLTKGILIMISTNDGDQFSDVDETKFELRGDSLYYNNKQVENTYVIFNISFEPLKGDDENSNWFKKYNDALNNLDKIIQTNDASEIEKIFADSKNMWMEGNALLGADETYINNEKLQIKAAAMKAIKDKYDLLKPAQPISSSAANEILSGMTATTTLQLIKGALPATGSFINENTDIEPGKTINFDEIRNLSLNDEKITELLNQDAKEYHDRLKENNILWKLGKTKP